MKDSLKYDDVMIRGNLSYRIGKNQIRLETSDYRPDKVFQKEDGWPGDWIGRTLLAIVMLSKASKREPAYLNHILRDLDKHLNEKGYFREIEENVINEQIISGHNWFLRALLELYLWNNDPSIASKAHNLVRGLYLSIKGKYNTYPLDPSLRSFIGGPSGEISGDIRNGWRLSTDIGCAYMSLDALSQYYSIFGNEEVGELLDEMCEQFMQIDFINTFMQTHASLSATRGIVRYYQSTGRQKLLTFAEKLFHTYVTDGMTENYANFNWFSRPTWTEPCAEVDSFMLATELFKITGKSEYIEYANRILYNALGFAQRENGGFGCDKCVSPTNDSIMLKVHDSIYEAYWCCTMRGGEGLSYAAANALMTEEDKVYLCNYNEGFYQYRNAKFELHSEYPYEGRIKILYSDVERPMKLHLFVPRLCNRSTSYLIVNGVKEVGLKDTNGFVEVIISKEGSIELFLDFILTKETTIGSNPSKKYFSVWYGVVMLGLETQEQQSLDWSFVKKKGQGGYQIGKNTLTPVSGSIYIPKDELLEKQYQVLFEE